MVGFASKKAKVKRPKFGFIFTFYLINVSFGKGICRTERRHPGRHPPLQSGVKTLRLP
jgi:hypothetical protein